MTKKIEETPLAPAMKISDWIIVFILTCIPVLNLIMLIIWSLDKRGNPNRRSFAQAVLIFVAVMLVLSSFYFGQMTGWLFQIMALM
ncbi:conserved hypothetical protein [Candidatus Cloacimonas acidaminovorans str. Evry]|uniref:Uncharacterized protein n=2 Tax=Candidatus Cloacimonas TaxID=456826 RepID=B0VFG4_CLOAI|nr:conserved hypothetical protein [Candidatus Cloacimonas acidaminovorans str. Evry]